MPVLGGGAQAQIGGPIRLEPPDARQPGDLPPPVTPVPPAIPVEARPLDDAPAPVAPVVEAAVETPDSGGTLPPGAGLFTPRLWTGTARAQVKTLLLRLPEGPRTPTLRRVQRDLLLTAGRLTPRPAQDLSLGLVRVQKLLAMGAPDDAAALAAHFAVADPVPEIAALDPAVKLEAGDFAAACAAVPTALNRSRAPVLLRLSAACQGAAKAGPAAALAIRLAEEELGEDPLLEALAIARDADTLPQIPGPQIPAAARFTPVHLPLLVSFDPVPWDLLKDRMTPAAAALVSRLPGVPDGVRLAAMAQSAAHGRLDAVDLVQGVVALGSGAESLPWSRGLAQAARGANPVQQMLGASALSRSRFDHALAAAAAALALKGLVPGADIAMYAETAGGLLLTGGARAEGMAFLDDLRRRHPAQAQLAPGWPLRALAEGGAASRLDRDDLLAWLDAGAGEEPEMRHRRAGLLVLLLDGLGTKLPAEIWEDVAEPQGPPVPAAALAALRRAALAERTGETAARLLALIGSPADPLPHPAVQAAAVAALVQLGHIDVARQLALEFWSLAER